MEGREVLILLQASPITNLIILLGSPTQSKQRVGCVPDLCDVIAKGGVKEKPDVDYLNDQQAPCK
jgi:hypothetical protein